MAIAIRPEERTMKVLVKTDPTYGIMKDLGGGHTVSVMDNHDGGKIVPFECYARNSQDPDLEWYDPETNERLGIYVPPVVLKERTEEERSNDLLSEMKQTNRLMALALAGKLSDDQKDKLVAQVLGEEVDEGAAVKEVQITEEHKAKAQEVLSAQWRERTVLAEKVTDIGVLKAIVEFIAEKPKVSATDQKVLEVVNTKIEAMSGDKVEGEDYVVIETDDDKAEKDIAEKIGGGFKVADTVNLKSLDALI